MSLLKRTLSVVAIVSRCPVALSEGPTNRPGISAEAGRRGPAVTSAQKPPSAEELAKLVAQLDAPRFADRQAASEKLAAIGKPAIGALAKVAVGDSPEVTSRAIGLLASLLESSDQPTKAAARTALETIARATGPLRPAVPRTAQAASGGDAWREGCH